ncbi:hypothetical protein DFH07DRAFT_691429, partial [Mycena maculata]
PVVQDPKKYVRDWWGWWGGLQPEWRTKDSEGTWVIRGDYGKEWDVLSFWGINGTLSVVASVYFWGCSVQGDSAELEEWECAANDVAWIFEGLA